jgi:hypothetical protein
MAEVCAVSRDEERQFTIERPRKSGRSSTRHKRQASASAGARPPGGGEARGGVQDRSLPSRLAASKTGMRVSGVQVPFRSDLSLDYCPDRRWEVWAETRGDYFEGSADFFTTRSEATLAVPFSPSMSACIHRCASVRPPLTSGRIPNCPGPGEVAKRRSIGRDKEAERSARSVK